MPMTIRPGPDQPALDRFRARVMADEALQDALAGIEDDAAFVGQVVAMAAAADIGLDPSQVKAAAAPDPLGIGRWMAAPVAGSHWPGPHWAPIHVSDLGGTLAVDWIHFGDRPLLEPLFEETIRRTLRNPFNRMFRYRMTLADFVDHAPLASPPDGLIFHMSRCGSTLVAQMLASLSGNVVLSEASPIDTIVQYLRLQTGWSTAQQGRYLRAMVHAFGRRRTSGTGRYVIKLDSWHTLALPFFLDAFGPVPWLFLYRDPVEVLVSQMRRRGSQMVPEVMPPWLYGLDVQPGISEMEYCGRVLQRICNAALDAKPASSARFINYRDLPGAVEYEVLPHFGIACNDKGREALAKAAQFDAKSPSRLFASDGQQKQIEATEEIRAVAKRHLSEVYKRLEQRRLRDVPSQGKIASIFGGDN